MTIFCFSYAVNKRNKSRFCCNFRKIFQYFFLSWFIENQLVMSLNLFQNPTFTKYMCRAVFGLGFSIINILVFIGSFVKFWYLLGTFFCASTGLRLFGAKCKTALTCFVNAVLMCSISSEPKQQLRLSNLLPVSACIQKVPTNRIQYIKRLRVFFVAII